ncbi:MAG: methionine gamma-lyase family protein [Clostridia bacterium]|nr:methionine gamma-lyase family protein [Clostridia bacterium]
MNIWQELYGVPAALQARAKTIEETCRPQFAQIERVQEYNQLWVLDCFRKERVAPAHFAPSYGYGYDDAGRDTLEKLFARVFKAQKALVRPSIASGTHALALALQGVTRRGTRILSASGTPYDTMESILGFTVDAPFSLKETGARYSELPLKNRKIDFAALVSAAKDADIVMLQRSRGYQDRPSLTMKEIARAAQIVHNENPRAIVFVDNCYGEFVETSEPIEAGADLIVGSLIKNAGGGLAPTGAYIAGREDLVDRIAYRMTAPGIGAEVGSYAAGYLPFYQGLFLAPQAVAQALKGAVFASAMLEDAGFVPSPKQNEARGCIIQSVRLGSKEKLTELCRQIQAVSPVDSFVTPVPAPMPGYADEVIMAAGTFIQGSSIELSGDAPIREPYILFMQGGLVYAQVKAAILCALARMEETS